VGIGASIVLSCDVVVASRTSFISDPHVLIGLAAGDGGCLLWPQAAGMLRARRYLLTGDRVPAELAYDFGLVTDLVDEPDEALPAALAIAQRIASLPPLGVRGTKQALVNLTKARAAEVVDLALANERRSLQSPDFLEAVDAAEHRRPGTYLGV
jgi:enoyl-CoA hydratase